MARFWPDYGDLVGELFVLLILLSKPIFLDTFEHLFLLYMTWSNLGKLHAYDPEIDKTFHRISQFSLDNMANNDRTLKEFTTLDVILIYLLPKFHGLAVRQYMSIGRGSTIYATCSHHQINEQLLIQYFYEGLMLMDKSMIDVASGRALMDKTRAVARNLISNLVGNTQQFGVRGSIASKVVNEDLVKQMATNNIQFQQNMNATIQDLQTEIGQLATIVNQLQSNGSRHLPSQIITT
ncbi:hypothetical protein CR513_26357, partial [Mucuna pruriens]